MQSINLRATELHQLTEQTMWDQYCLQFFYCYSDFFTKQLNHHQDKDSLNIHRTILLPMAKDLTNRACIRRTFYPCFVSSLTLYREPP
ncbi:hypothetical protein HXW98_24685 (plasmid) [Shigella flexneri]|nr:hypothetical protein HXW98_24685 [Shigella flexneri]CSE53593.1 Uncharacterised protein [Shigella sonnei]CSP96474.1 Uncharacterised protein [Shigella sonnei]SRN32807.1 Uncharacterised protein [Shigella flexneri]